MLDVIPAGRRGGYRLSGDGAPDEMTRGDLRAELLRLGRRYELIVVAAPPGAPQTGNRGILPVSEAVVCARIAFTTLSRLATSVSVLQDSGLRVRGIVLWNADSPPRVPMPHDPA
jgi:Mrp family chromosome partitioning ATPase